MSKAAKGIELQTAAELEADHPTAGGITPELLTCKEAARLAGCAERTWWSWSRSGLAPKPLFIGVGVRPACRYRRSEILQWIQSGCPRTDGRASR